MGSCELTHEDAAIKKKPAFEPGTSGRSKHDESAGGTSSSGWQQGQAGSTKSRWGQDDGGGGWQQGQAGSTKSWWGQDDGGSGWQQGQAGSAKSWWGQDDGWQQGQAGSKVQVGTGRWRSRSFCERTPTQSLTGLASP